MRGKFMKKMIILVMILFVTIIGSSCSQKVEEGYTYQVGLPLKFSSKSGETFEMTSRKWTTQQFDNRVYLSWNTPRNHLNMYPVDLTIPATYKDKSIFGIYGFYGDTSIRSIDMSTSHILFIYPYAFEDCSHLQVVTLPENLGTIGGDNKNTKNVFAGCTMLKEIMAPERFQWFTRQYSVIDGALYSFISSSKNSLWLVFFPPKSETELVIDTSRVEGIYDSAFASLDLKSEQKITIHVSRSTIFSYSYFGSKEAFENFVNVEYFD